MKRVSHLWRLAFYPMSLLIYFLLLYAFICVRSQVMRFPYQIRITLLPLSRFVFPVQIVCLVLPFSEKWLSQPCCKLRLNPWLMEFCVIALLGIAGRKLFKSFIANKYPLYIGSTRNSVEEMNGTSFKMQQQLASWYLVGKMLERR